MLTQRGDTVLAVELPTCSVTVAVEEERPLRLNTMLAGPVMVMLLG